MILVYTRKKLEATNLFTIFDDGRTVLDNETQLRIHGSDLGCDGTDATSDVDDEAVFGQARPIENFESRRVLC